MLLLAVLPLQGMVQLLAGLQGRSHLHTDAAHAVASPSPLRLLLNQLHAAHDPRLTGHRLGAVPASEAAAGLHEHGGAYHRHDHDTAAALEVGDAAEDAGQGAATAFLAWLPGPLAVPGRVEGGDRPDAAGVGWRDRVVAPLLTPPRG